MAVTGAKAILYRGEEIVTILRDDLPGLPFAGYWDLPGGGVEAGETGVQAALREIGEEIGLRLESDAFVWDRVFVREDGRASQFFAAPLNDAQVAAIRLGDEGQDWRMMAWRAWVARGDTIPHFRARVAGFFEGR